MVKVKICGITNLEDALLVAEAGADALGFVFVPGSPRYIEPSTAEEIQRYLPPFLSVVGVFADARLEEVRQVAEACHLSAIQLHGEESPAYCSSLGMRIIKAFRVKDEEVLVRMSPYRVEAFLLDSYCSGQRGGTGKTFDWRLAREAKRYGRLILSGGLTPENVAEGIRTVRPYGVDVSSGVEERPGKKEKGKVKKFLEEVTRADSD